MIDEEVVTARVAKIREYANLLIHERMYDEAKAGLADFERFCEAIVRFLQSRKTTP